MSKEQTPIEKAYDLWLCEHPKRDYSYKAWTHRARAIEFSQFYTQAKVLEALEQERERAKEEVLKILGIEWNDIEKHLHIEDLRTGEKEYILSFDTYIGLVSGSQIIGRKFKISVDKTINGTIGSFDNERYKRKNGIQRD